MNAAATMESAGFGILNRSIVLGYFLEYFYFIIKQFAVHLMLHEAKPITFSWEVEEEMFL